MNSKEMKIKIPVRTFFFFQNRVFALLVQRRSAAECSSIDLDAKTAGTEGRRKRSREEKTSGRRGGGDEEEEEVESDEEEEKEEEGRVHE